MTDTKDKYFSGKIVNVWQVVNTPTSEIVLGNENG